MGTYWSNLVDNYLSTEPETTTEETTLVDKYKKGDVNTDGEINVSDLIVLQKYLLKKAVFFRNRPTMQIWTIITG